jgi:hypothetical protein
MVLWSISLTFDEQLLRRFPIVKKLDLTFLQNSCSKNIGEIDPWFSALEVDDPQTKIKQNLVTWYYNCCKTDFGVGIKDSYIH